MKIEYEGNAELFNSRCVAIIGTREPSEFGKRSAYKIAQFLASEEGSKHTIVSGLAYGIDSWAHRGALSVPDGKTIAILGQTVRKIYPKENAPLADSILRQGGLLYYAHGTDLISRDYLQAEQSLAVIPVQAGDKSGTRHATLYAISHKKPVFIPIPNEEDRLAFPEKYVGIEQYIRDGSKVGVCTTFEGKKDYPKLLAILSNL